QTILRERFERRGPGSPSEVASVRSVADLLLGEVETPFVGREAERDQLRLSLEAAWSGEGRTAILRGEAGIGKSRLAAEVVRDAFDHDGRVMVGRGHETHQILPFGPWI